MPLFPQRVFLDIFSQPVHVNVAKSPLTYLRLKMLSLMNNVIFSESSFTKNLCSGSFEQCIYAKQFWTLTKIIKDRYDTLLRLYKYWVWLRNILRFNKYIKDLLKFLWCGILRSKWWNALWQLMRNDSYPKKTRVPLLIVICLNKGKSKQTTEL